MVEIRQDEAVIGGRLYRVPVHKSTHCINDGNINVSSAEPLVSYPWKIREGVKISCIVLAIEDNGDGYSLVTVKSIPDNEFPREQKAFDFFIRKEKANRLYVGKEITFKSEFSW